MKTKPKLNLLLRWVFPSLILFLISLSVIGYYTNLNVVGTGVYYCPPCGCTGDHEEHEKGDICEYCGMPVIEEKITRFENVKQFVANQYRGSSTHGTVYTKFVYPILFGGIIVGVLSVLFFRRKSIELFLALFIVVWSLFGFKFQMYGTGYGFSLDVNTAFLPISMLVFLGPLIYFHTKGVLDDFFHFDKRLLFHLVPGGIFFLAYSVLFLLPAEAKQDLLITDFDPYIVVIEQVFGIISLVIYLSASYRYVLERYEHSKKRTEINWLNRLFLATYALMIIWLINLGGNAVFFELKSATITYFSLWVSLCIYIFWIGIEILRNEKFLILKNFNSKPINGGELEEFKEKFKQIMDEHRPYTDPNLTLRKLAELLELKPKELSGLMNSSYQKNFYAIVNEYRINEVKELLIDEDYKHLTIVAIAEKAGFNSKSTFNSTFKKEVGMTPKEFKSVNTSWYQ